MSAWLQTHHVAKDSLSVLQWRPGSYINVIIGTCLGDGGIDINLGDRRTFSTDICSVLAWPLEQNTVDWELKTTGYFVVGVGGVGFVCVCFVSPGAWKSRIKLAATVPGVAFLPDLQRVSSSPHPNMGCRESTLSVLSLYGTNPISGPPFS